MSFRVLFHMALKTSESGENLKQAIRAGFSMFPQGRGVALLFRKVFDYSSDLLEALRFHVQPMQSRRYQL